VLTQSRSDRVKADQKPGGLQSLAALLERGK
jgi:hypothetical protein